MSYYDFPHTRNYDTDLGWLIQHINDWDDELAKKADITYVDEQLSYKADQTYVDEQLDLKLNITQYDSDMAKLTEELSNKVDMDVYQLQVEQIETELDAKVDSNIYEVKVKEIEDSLAGKQDTLVSGTNIKTINGNSILGEGNIVIEGGGGSSVDIIDDLTSERTDAALSANQGRVLNEKFNSYATNANLVTAQQECIRLANDLNTTEANNRIQGDEDTLTAAKAYVDEQLTNALTAEY